MIRPLSQPHLLDLSYEELKEKLGDSYRLRQVCEWVFEKRARSFEDMTSLPLDLRRELDSQAALRNLQVERTEESRIDRTSKFTFKTCDKQNFSCVFLPHKSYNSLCISTQLGCAWECSFCASGLIPFSRNLTSGEILDQIFLVEEQSGRKIRNVLFMGMGEPLSNYSGTVRTIRWLTSPHGFKMNPSRIVLSTTGLAPQIAKISGEKLQVNLALSLHAPNEALRKKIMPKSSRFPIPDVLAACKKYWQENGGEFTVEYILLRGVNDRKIHAEELSRLLLSARFPSLPKINLIPQNPVGTIALQPSLPQAAEAFFAHLKKKNFNVHTRKPQGQDLDAACGQLL